VSPAAKNPIAKYMIDSIMNATPSLHLTLAQGPRLKVRQSPTLCSTGPPARAAVASIKVAKGYQRVSGARPSLRRRPTGRAANVAALAMLGLGRSPL
jgi:hypothetical protein